MKARGFRFVFSLLVLLCVWGGLWAQGGGGTDGDGNPIVYRERFELKPGEPGGVDGEWPLPAGWSSQKVKAQGNNAPLEWKRRKGGEFKKIGDPSTYYPRRAGEGEHNAALVANDDVAMSLLISVPYDLRARTVREAALTFLYCSQRRSGEADEVQLRYRLKADGEWKEMKDRDGQVMKWGYQESWERKVVLIKEVLDRDKVKDSDRGSVQVGFLGVKHRGYGACVDDVMIVELKGRVVSVASADYQGYSGPVGEGTKLNEAGLFTFEVKPGIGAYKLMSFGLEFTGSAVQDVEKLWLYRTSSPAFLAQPRDRLGSLELTGNRVTSINWEGHEQERNQFGSGKHYFWVVMDVRSDPGSTSLKHKLRFKVPRESIVFHFVNGGQSSTQNGYKYPSADLEPALGQTIYKTVYQMGFESTESTSDWTLGSSSSGGWRIGRLSSNQPDASLTPREAFSGDRVLATSKEVNGLLVGHVERGSPTSPVVRVAECTKEIVTRNYSDVRMKLRYSLGLDPKAEVSVRVKPSDGDWETVWSARNRKTANAWNPLPLSLTSYATRRDHIKIGFQLTSEDVKEEGYWGLFVDDVQILGDYVRSDVGVSRIDAPKGMTFGSPTPFKVYIRNYGAERVNQDVPVKVTLSNGQEVTVKHTGGLDPNTEVGIDVTTIDLTPVLDGSNLLVVTAVTQLGDDDDATNDGLSAEFYAFPTFEVSGVRPYPVGARRRMQHWFGSAVGTGGKHSWGQYSVHDLQGDKKLKFREPPFSAYVWTTGAEKCLRRESSVLTGPILDLQGDEEKQVVLTYAQEGGALHVEYRTGTSGSNDGWQRLDKSGHSEGWYESGQSFTSTTVMGGSTFRTVKVQLPSGVKRGKLQLRLVYSNATDAEVLGVAINQVQVRALQPDFQVRMEGIELTKCTDADVNARGHVQFKIRNGGLANSLAFKCPVEVTVYEQQLAGMSLPPAVLPTTLEGFEALGGLRLHGSRQLAVDVPVIPVGGEYLVDPKGDDRLEALWNYPSAYYVVHVRIFPERVDGVVDDDYTNNELLHVVKPRLMPVPLFMRMHAIYRTLYVDGPVSASRPYTISLWNGRPVEQGGGLRFPQIADMRARTFVVEEFLTGGGINPISTTYFTKPSGAWANRLAKEAKFDKLGKFKVKYYTSEFDASYSFSPLTYGSMQMMATSTFPKRVCERTEEFTLAEYKAVAELVNLDFLDEIQVPPAQGQGKVTGYGCYNAHGERVRARVRALGGMAVPAGTVRLVVYANGQKVQDLPIQTQLTAGTSDIELPSVLIPAGFSRIDAWLEGMTDPQGTAQRETITSLTYRWHPEDPMTVLVRNVNDHSDFFQLEYDGALNRYKDLGYFSTKSLQLHVVPTENVKYQWYKGELTDASPLMNRVGNGSSVELGEETAAYELEYMMAGQSGCSRRTARIHVRADDLELLSFVGGEGRPGLCPSSDGSAKVLVAIQNLSRTRYKAGTKLKFRFTPPSGVAREMEYTLQRDFEGFTREDIPLEDVQGLTSHGTRRFKLELLTVGGVPDGNLSNNVLEQDVQVLPRPRIYFGADPSVDPHVVRQRFLSTSTYTLQPTVTPDARSYTWWYKEESGEGQFESLNHTDGSYDIHGIPHDEYRVVVTNGVGCTGEATVRFVQRDLGVASIDEPTSKCALTENEARAVVTVQNYGSKGIKAGTEFTLSLFAEEMSTALVTESVRLTDPLGPGASLSHRLDAPGLAARLQGKDRVKVRAQITFAAGDDGNDIDAQNNAQVVEIEQYGYPDAGLQMRVRPTGTYDVGVNEGDRLIILEQKRGFQNAGDGVTKYWEYQSVGPDGSEGPALKISTEPILDLPTAETIAESSDKRGSGRYRAVTENAFFCRREVSFYLSVHSVDLAVSEVVTPADACSFPDAGGISLQVELENKGSLLIPRRVPVDAYSQLGSMPDQVMKLKYRVVDKGMSLQGGPLEGEWELPSDWPVGGTLRYTIPIGKEKLKNGDGEYRYEFEATVSFVDGDWMSFDVDAGNNTLARTMTDFADVRLEQLDVSDQKGRTATWYPEPLSGTPNRLTYMPDAGNRVQVRAQVTEPTGAGYTYAWEYDAATLQKVSGSDKEHSFTGSGDVCLRVKSGASVGGCERSICGMILVDKPDMTILDSKSPLAQTLPKSNCLSNYNPTTGLRVQFALHNIGAQPFPQSASAAVSVTYEVFNSSGEKIYGPREKRYPLGAQLGLQSGGVLPLDHDPVVGLSGLGTYTMKYHFTLEGMIAEDVSNNHREYTFEIYGAPTLAQSGQSDWSPVVSYRAKERIGVDNADDLRDLKNFQWQRLLVSDGVWDDNAQDRMLYSQDGTGFVEVEMPAWYMVKYFDGNGCAGYARREVRFPGYIDPVTGGSESAIVSPRTGCTLSGQEPFSLRVRNNGKQSYTNRSVPVHVELAGVGGAAGVVKDIMMQLEGELKPGAEGTLTSDLTFDMSSVREYTLKASIGDDDNARTAAITLGLAEARPEVTSQVSHLLTPKVPDLAQQARASLDAFNPNIKFDYVPRAYEGRPVRFELDARVPMDLTPAQSAGLVYKWSAGGWTGSSDAKDPKTEFNASGSYFVTVGIRYSDDLTCSATSDKVDLQYANQYVLGAEVFPVLSGDPSSHCLGEGQRKEVSVKMRVQLVSGDEPIRKGSRLRLRYEFTKSPMFTMPFREGEGFLALEDDLSVGGSLEYEFPFRPEVIAGDYSVSVLASYKNTHEEFESASSSGSTHQFHVPWVPEFTFDPSEVSGAGTVTLRAPSLRELPNGGAYEYFWNSGQSTPEIEVSTAGAYSLKVTSPYGCTYTSEVRASLTIPVRWTSGEGGTVVVTHVKQDGTLIRELHSGDGVPSNSIVHVIAKASPGWEMNTIKKNGENRHPSNRFTYEADEDILGETMFEFTFRRMRESASVVSDGVGVLSGVYSVSPFDGMLVLGNASEVSRYELVSEQGVVVRRGVNVEGSDRLEVLTFDLGEGLYLVRVHARDGSMRVLRAVRIRR